jgi:hypothetical protein
MMWRTHADGVIPCYRYKGVFAPVEKSLYVSYINLASPFNGKTSSLTHYNGTSKTWKVITLTFAKADSQYRHL